MIANRTAPLETDKQPRIRFCDFTCFVFKAKGLSYRSLGQRPSILSAKIPKP